jgi:hypothetical protein
VATTTLHALRRCRCTRCTHKQLQTKHIHKTQTHSCIALWVALSSCVILVNKAVLDPSIGGFPYPLALAALHMLTCSLLSMALVASGAVEAPPMPVHVYVKGVLPIGALFALTLWASNAAYLHLSVSFIQMAKAATPLLVYALGVAAGAERFERGYIGVMAAIAGGVALASYGMMVFFCTNKSKGIKCKSLLSLGSLMLRCTHKKKASCALRPPAPRCRRSRSPPRPAAW